MSRLDITLDGLRRPGTGLLVVDEYADPPARRRHVSASDLAPLVADALRSPLAGDRLTGAVLSECHLRSMPPPVDLWRTDGPPFVGLRLAVRPEDPGTTAALLAARRRGADLVELRANRRPGQFPRRETHVAVDPLAAAAAEAQRLDLLPVLSVSMPDLGRNTIGVCRAVTVNALTALFAAAVEHGVDLSRVVVRTNLVAPGLLARTDVTPDQVATATLDALDEAVPAAVPAVLFLSSGRSLAAVCEHLAALAEVAAARGVRRHLGYAMGRAFVEPMLDAVAAGDPAGAQRDLASACDALHRALVSAAVSPRS